MPMSLIPVLLTRALALVLAQHFSLLVYGSDGGITLPSKRSLLAHNRREVVPPLRSAVTRIAVRSQSKRMAFQHH